MALQAEVRAEYEGLVGAEVALENARGAGGNREGFAVPVKGFEAVEIAEPVAGGRVGDLYLPPADFLDRVLGDRAAERLAHQLAAKTVADDWYVGGDRAADQFEQGGQPGQVVIHAHRPAHEAQAGVIFNSRRRCYAGVDGNKLPWDVVRIEESGKIARTFSGAVTKDGNGFHDDAQ